MKKLYTFVSVSFLLALTVVVNAQPTVPASAITSTNIVQTQADLGWTRGDGDSCAVFIFQGNTGTAVPVDNTSYGADAAFGTGDEISSSGWFCVYNGTGTSVSVTALTANTNYLVMVVEYDGTTGTELYLLSSGSNNPAGFSTIPNFYTVSGNGSYCAGTDPTSVDVQLSGSDAGVSYQLQNAGNDVGSPVVGNGAVLVWEDVTAGTYTILATGLAGTFPMLANAVVTENALPSVSFTGLDALYCLDADTAVLVPNIEGGTFYGDGISHDTLFVPANAGAGTYTIAYSYSDANGCADTAFQDVDVAALPIINMPADTTHCGEFYTFDAGAGFTSYLWSTDSTSQTITSDTSGTFYVTVTDANGCVNSSMTTLTMNVVIFTVPDTLNSCSGADLELTATAVSGFVIWNHLDTTSTITVNPTVSEYNYITLVDGSCIINDSIYINVAALPVVNLPADTTNCGSGYIFDAGAGFAEYLWTTGDTTQTISVDTSGVFYVTVTDMNGCSNFAMTDLTINLADLTVSDTVDFCTGADVVLTASSTAGIIIWNQQDTTNSITVTPAAEQYYLVTLVDGICVVNDSVLVTPHDFPVVNLPATQTECGQLTLNAGTGPNSYIWTGGSTNASLTVTQSGTYNVTVTNDWGCSVTDNAVITILTSPNVNLGADFTIAMNQTVILGTSPNYPNYLWSTGATTYSIALTGSDLGVGIHDLWLRVNLANGCSKTDTVVVNVTWASTIDENATNAITVYPNPAVNYISISESDNNPVTQVIITDITGKIIVNKTNGNLSQIAVDALSEGLYYVAITSNNKTTTKLITIVR